MTSSLYLCFTIGENDFSDAYIYGLYDSMSLLTEDLCNNLVQNCESNLPVLICSTKKNTQFNYEDAHYYDINRADKTLQLSKTTYPLPRCFC